LSTESASKRSATANYHLYYQIHNIRSQNNQIGSCHHHHQRQQQMQEERLEKYEKNKISTAITSSLKSQPRDKIRNVKNNNISQGPPISQAFESLFSNDPIYTLSSSCSKKATQEQQYLVNKNNNNMKEQHQLLTILLLYYVIIITTRKNIRPIIINISYHL